MLFYLCVCKIALNYIKLKMITYKTTTGRLLTKTYDHNEKEINLSLKNIVEIIEIKGLNNLQCLWLEQNYITEIKGLDELINLRELRLSINHIKEIKGLNKLVRLESLMLYSNKITEIKGLDSLTNLQNLSLDNNQ